MILKNLKTLVTMLVLGTSTAAIADPVVRDHRDDSPGYSEYRAPDRPDDGMRGRWQHRQVAITLADDISLGRSRRATFISISQGIHKVRLDAENGRTYVENVWLQFADGRTQQISVKQMLSPRNESFTLNLDGRVTGLWISGSSMRGRGSIDVIGMRR